MASLNAKLVLRKETTGRASADIVVAIPRIVVVPRRSTHPIRSIVPTAAAYHAVGRFIGLTLLLLCQLHPSSKHSANFIYHLGYKSILVDTYKF